MKRFLTAALAAVLVLGQMAPAMVYASETVQDGQENDQQGGQPSGGGQEEESQGEQQKDADKQQGQGGVPGGGTGGQSQTGTSGGGDNGTGSTGVGGTGSGSTPGGNQGDGTQGSGESGTGAPGGSTGGGNEEGDNQGNGTQGNETQGSGNQGDGVQGNGTQEDGAPENGTQGDGFQEQEEGTGLPKGEEPGETGETGTEEADPMQVTAEEVLNYLYIDYPEITEEAMQNIVVSVGEDGAALEDAVLTLLNGEEESTLEAVNYAGNAALFSKDFSEDIGVYQVQSMAYTVDGTAYEVSFAGCDMESVSFTVGEEEAQ